MTSLCECGHPWSRHTSGGMCAGDPPDGSECYCVLFAPDQPFDHPDGYYPRLNEIAAIASAAVRYVDARRNAETQPRFVAEEQQTFNVPTEQSRKLIDAAWDDLVVAVEVTRLEALGSGRIVGYEVTAAPDCNCGVSTGESACTDHAPDCPCSDASEASPKLGEWRRKPKPDGGQFHA